MYQEMSSGDRKISVAPMTDWTLYLNNFIRNQLL